MKPVHTTRRPILTAPLLLLAVVVMPAASSQETSDAELTQLEATARRLYAADQLSAAGSLYEELAARESGDRRARALSLAAWLAHLDQDPDRARGLLMQLKQESPDFVIDPDRFDDGFLALWDSARSSDPAAQAADGRSAEMDRALSLLRAGDWTAARQALGSILAVDPTSPATLFALARLEASAGSFQRSERFVGFG